MKTKTLPGISLPTSIDVCDKPLVIAHHDMSVCEMKSMVRHEHHEWISKNHQDNKDADPKNVKLMG